MKIDFGQFSIQILIFWITKKIENWFFGNFQLNFQFLIISNYSIRFLVISNSIFNFFWNMQKIENWFLTSFNQFLTKFFMKIQFFWKMEKLQVAKKLSRSQGPKQIFSEKRKNNDARGLHSENWNIIVKMHESVTLKTHMKKGIIPISRVEHRWQSTSPIPIKVVIFHAFRLKH